MNGARASKTGLLAAVALSSSVVLARTTPAIARARGIVTDSCQACHSGGDVGAPTLSLTADPATFNPGDLVTFTLAVSAENLKVGGTFITSGSVGALRSLAGEGLQLNGSGLTHLAPKAALNGVVTFRFAWQAPTQPSGVVIGVAALAGNGNNSSAGDAAAGRAFQWTFGCAAQTFYVDLDRDGYGTKEIGTLLGCAGAAAPEGFASRDGDCNENDETAHPGATEVCNRKDDNCDSQIDEGSAPVTMWPDQDGDGYYGAQVGVSKIGCGNVAGYAVRAGDCDDKDAAVHPQATELCNVRDDDCDGDVDEHVRPRCGLGWCARLSPSCSSADCEPGPPTTETCNLFDDDCDGEIDNDACPTGYVCAGEACVASDQTAATAGGSAGGASGSPLGGASSSEIPKAGSGHAAPRESGCAISPSERRPREARFGRQFFAVLCAGCLAIRVIRRRQRRN